MGDPIPAVTTRWIAQLSVTLRDRMAKCGLAQNGSMPTALEDVMAYCLAMHEEKHKPSMHRNMKRSADALVDHFGKKKLISMGDARTCPNLRNGDVQMVQYTV